MATKFILLQDTGDTTYVVPVGKQVVVSASLSESAGFAYGVFYLLNGNKIVVNNTAGGSYINSAAQKVVAPAGSIFQIVPYNGVVTNPSYTVISIIELDVDDYIQTGKRYLPIQGFNVHKQNDISIVENAVGVIPTGTYANVVGGLGYVTTVNIGASTNIALQSTRGMGWGTRALPNTIAWSDIAFGNEIFVAVGNGVSATSVDGSVWKGNNTISSGNNKFSVTYGNGVFMAIATTGGNSTTAFTSPDGVTWTATGAFTSANYKAIQFGGGVFVITNDSSNSILVTDDNGATWTTTLTGGFPGASENQTIAYGNGKFVVISDSAVGSGTAYAHTVYTSSNYGTSWTAYTVTATNNSNVSNITYGNGLFALNIVGSTTGYFTSPDGITWTLRPYPVGATSFKTISYANNIFFAHTNANYMIQGFDGINWETSTTGSPLPIVNDNYIKTSYVNNKQFLWGIRYVMSSANYLTGTINTTALDKVADICYGTKYVAVTYNSNDGYTSTDGVAWSPMTLPSTAKWTTVASNGANLYITAAMNSNKAATSADGITWTARTLPATSYWNSLAFANGIFVITSSNSQTILTTTDGITWTSQNVQVIPSRIFSINNTFIVISRDIVMSSTNGVNWTTWAAPGVVIKSYMLGTAKLYIETSTSTYKSTDGIFFTLVDARDTVNLVIGEKTNGLVYYDTVNSVIF